MTVSNHEVIHRRESEERVAGWMDAARLLDQRASVLDAMSISDFGEEARAVRELAAVANELRIMADKATSAEDHKPVWVTALDGDNEPARDAEGRTWVHCGICGVQKQEGDRRPKRCVGCGEPLDNGKSHGYGNGYGGCM